MADDGLEWARHLADEAAWVMHLPTGTIGRVARLYDGRGELYVSAVSQTEVKAPVLEMAPARPGDAAASYVATPSAFIRLAEREARFFEGFQSSLAQFLAEAAVFGATAGVARATGMALVAAALRQQLAEIQKGRSPGEPGA